MSVTTENNTTGAAQTAVGPSAAPPLLERPRRHRRRGVLALMVLLVVCGGAAAWWGVDRATERVAVVAIVSPVAWGETLTADDIAMVEVVQDPLLTPVPWSARDSIIGGHATRDLPAGTFITANSVSRQDLVPGLGQALVGLAVRPAQAPVTPLRPGDHVLVIPQAGQATEAGSTTTAPTTVTGIVYAVGGTNSDGARTIDVIVEEKSAAALSQASAAGRVALVLVPREGS